MIIDSHQHFWNLERHSYPWLTSVYGPIQRTFEPGDLEPLLRECGVSATVVVQAMDSYEDTDAMLERADRTSWIRGVVGWVPLDRPAEAATALERYAQHPRFKGVRHLIHEQPDPDWLLQDSVTDGLRLLAERGLSFDVVSVLPRHLEHVPVLCERVPELRIVIDHLSKPPIKERGWQPWADLIADAATSPNVFAKVSGLNTAADWESWTADDLPRYLEHAIEHFGARRLMFGSDWPVANLAGGYVKAVRETQGALNSIGAQDQPAIWAGTANAFYRLGVDPQETFAQTNTRPRTEPRESAPGSAHGEADEM